MFGLDNIIDFSKLSESRYHTFFECKIHLMQRDIKLKCKFDTGAVATILALEDLADEDNSIIELAEKIRKQGKQVTDLYSYTGIIPDVYELPVTELIIGNISFKNISVCVALQAKRSLIGMDLVGLLDFKYNPELHRVTYTHVRKWQANPELKYTVARQIEEVNCKEDDSIYCNTNEPIHSVHSGEALSDDGIIKEIEEIFGYTVDEDRELE